MVKESGKSDKDQASESSESEAHRHWTVLEADLNATEVTKQGHLIIPGINDQTAGTTQVAANLIAMAPGDEAKGHRHRDHESIIWVLYGHAVTFMGPEQTPTFQGPGDWLFIGKNVDHLPANLSEDEPVIAIVFRADPKFVETLERRHIDAIAKQLLPELRAQHAAGNLPEGWQQYALSIEPLLQRYRQVIMDFQQSKQ